MDLDRKTIVVLVICFISFIVWYRLADRYYAPVPAAGGTNAVQQTNGMPRPAAAVARPIETESAPVLPPLSGKEQLLSLSNSTTHYTFTSHGGGLKWVQLEGYPVVTGCGSGAGASKGRAPITLNTNAAVPAFALLGGVDPEPAKPYRLSHTKDGAVRAEKRLTNGLVILKTFRPESNFLMRVEIRLENQSTHPISLRPGQLVIGTATGLSPDESEREVGLEWFNGKSLEQVSKAWFDNKTFGCFRGTPRQKYQGGATNVAWAAVHDQFFVMATMAPSNAPAPAVVAYSVPLAPAGAGAASGSSSKDAAAVGFQTALVYGQRTLAPRHAAVHDYLVYAGPKEYNTLARLGERLGNKVDLVMGFHGFFGFFSKALLLSMNGLHSMGLGYGISIVVITVLIKLFFWPLTQASTRSMKRMAALQPQMKALQEKYKEDPKKMNAKLMEFMKEHKVSPLGGCLPMVLQIPVLFGFYFMIRSAIELRGASFLWACDLSRPDTIFLIPGTHIPVNPLAILMAVCMLWQSRLTPPSPGADPMQQKLTRYLPIGFVVLFYNYSSGLTLYWTVQNLLTILQMKLTKTNPTEIAGGKETKPGQRQGKAPRRRR